MDEFKKIHHLIELQSLKYAHHTALQFNNESITYAQLNAKANQMASFFREKGIGPGCLIPVVSEKSIALIVVLLAILKTGAAFVPISSDTHEHVLNDILLSINAQIVCCSILMATKVLRMHPNGIILETLLEKSSEYSEIGMLDSHFESEIAYVIYTSGTTGKPKGVMVSHENVLNTFYSWKEVYELSADDVHLQMANIGFDVFIGDLIRALCTGAKLVFCVKEQMIHPSQLYQLITDQQITCAEFVPAVLKELMTFAKEYEAHFSSFRLVLCGSDLWTMKDYFNARRIFGSRVRVINSYGITEATIDSSYFETETEIPEDENKLVPIGKPFPHVNLYVFDESLQTVRPGQTGELYIGGGGVSVGYLGQELLTKERFVMHPQKNERLYKSGDLCRLSAEGAIEFLGRNQSFVKINGQRVELLALETVLNTHPKIKQAIAYQSKSEEGHFYLGCWIMPLNNSLCFEEVSAHIKKYLPNYYLPQKIDLISRIQFNQNGKIDRTPEIQQLVSALKPGMQFPINKIEEQLVGLWKRYLQHDQLGTTQTFTDLGGSSLTFISLLELINSTFKLNLRYNDPSVTIKDLALTIQSLLLLSTR